MIDFEALARSLNSAEEEPVPSKARIRVHPLFDLRDTEDVEFLVIDYKDDQLIQLRYHGGVVQVESQKCMPSQILDSIQATDNLVLSRKYIQNLIPLERLGIDNVYLKRPGAVDKYFQGKGNFKIMSRAKLDFEKIKGKVIYEKNDRKVGTTATSPGQFRIDDILA